MPVGRAWTRAGSWVAEDPAGQGESCGCQLIWKDPNPRRKLWGPLCPAKLGKGVVTSLACL